MNFPLVSVVIYSYNHQAYIRDAIEGCLMQKTSFPYEIIIHDDASTDDSKKIICEYVEKHPDKIIPILQIENQMSKGVDFTESFIIPKAQGKYLAICEGDDYWIDPNKLEKQVTIMEQDDSISMCFTGYIKSYENVLSSKDEEIRFSKSNKTFTLKDAVIKGGAFAHVLTTLYRTKVHDSLTNYYKQNLLGDTSLFIFLASKGDVYYLNEITAVHRRNVPGSWTERTSRGQNRATHLEKFIKFYDVLDKETEFQFHKEINKKTRKATLKLLLVLPNHKKFLKAQLLERLSKFEKATYYFLNYTRFYRVYRFLLNLLRKWRIIGN